MQTVTKYLSADGREHDSEADAVLWDVATEASKLIADAMGIPAETRWHGEKDDTPRHVALTMMRHNPKALRAICAALKGAA